MISFESPNALTYYLFIGAEDIRCIDSFVVVNSPHHHSWEIKGRHWLQQRISLSMSWISMKSHHCLSHSGWRQRQPVSHSVVSRMLNSELIETLIMVVSFRKFLNNMITVWVLRLRQIIKLIIFFLFLRIYYHFFGFF